MLTAHGVYAEPSEDIHDYRLDLPEHGFVLVHDQENSIVEVHEFLRAKSARIPIIAYSETPQLEKVVNAIHAGAIDYLPWPFDAAKFVDGLECRWHRFAAKRDLLLREQRAKARLASLTKREKDVLNGISLGRTSSEIGTRLSISPRTVEIHRLNAISKLGARRTGDAVRLLVEAKLTEEPDQLD